MQIEKRMMFIILTLIVAVAAFNLVSTLVMTVTDKQRRHRDPAHAGRDAARVMAIFMVQGALIGVIGTLLGVAGGLFVALNIDTIVPAIERIAGVPSCPKDVYFISAAIDPQRERHRADRRDLARAGARRHALPELARGAGESGRGAAL